jgi:hypothetical protein
MSDKIKVPEMIRMSIRNEMGIKKSFYNTDTNTLVIPTSFIDDNELLDDLFNEMSDDLKKKYQDNRPTMYVKNANAQGKVYPIMVDDDNNVINFTKNPSGEGGRRRKSHRRKSYRRRSHRRRSHRRRH